MTKDGRRQGERRQGSRRKGDRREEERRQESYRTTCIEIAKHVGVLSVGLSLVLHGIITKLSLNKEANFLLYVGSGLILISVCGSMFIMCHQLPDYFGWRKSSKILKKNSLEVLKMTINMTVWFLIIGACCCFFYVAHLVLPYLPKVNG